MLSILAVTAIGGGAFVLLRGGREGGGGGEERPPADLAWEVGFTKVVAVDEKPPQARVDSATEEISALMDELYTTAFVDPARWGGGSFPDLDSYFSGPAAQRAVEDLEQLTLGSLAPRVARVDPGASRLNISVLVDEDSGTTAAIARAAFRADARTKGGEKFKIFHRGRYLMEQVDGGWRITGYDIAGEINPSAGVGEPAPGPSAEATP